jgi:protein phosphatase
MNKLIPSHALVVVIGACADARAEMVNAHFEDYEVISPQKAAFDLVGEVDRPDLNSIVFAEVRRIASLKLSLGERAVINAPNLRREDRLSLVKLATDHGIPVFYLLCDPAGADAIAFQRWIATEREVLRGDGVAEVIDWRVHVPAPVSKRLPDLATLRKRWHGITVIADLHGMYQSLLSALAWARSRHHYVVYLGDVIDYGRETLDVADEVYRTVMRGEGEMLLGNHERKISRWAVAVERGWSYGKLSEGNQVTVDALAELSPQTRRRWLGRFQGLVSRTSITRQIGSVTFAHAAIHPDYWSARRSRDVEAFALFGEYDDRRTDDLGRAVRSYAWTKAVPAAATVIVGHDIRSTTAPLRIESAQAGQTIFLDTGCGKGGHLTTADLKFTDTDLRLESYRMY